MKKNFPVNVLAIAIAASAGQVLAEEIDSSANLEEVTVVGKSVSYANNASSLEMVKQQSAMTSPMAVIDNLPGVLVNEGDTFGTDDWSTTVSIRGFQLSLDEQQVGITVDGIANGNSNYGGGAKANRFIDTENLQTVEVSQGTADIASRSNEALGGTLNFTTIDPGEEEKLTISFTSGDFDARKYFVRYETGEIAPETYAWVSVSSTENGDWIQQAAENTRDHIAAKLISTINDINITAYLSYDDTHEDNYQRVSLSQFESNPGWDRLTSDWTGTPYVDQLYRRGWSTLRENFLTYLKADFNVGEVEVQTNVYFHKNDGRGDWVPPYLVDVTDNGANGHSELNSGTTVLGGAPIGRIFFVDANGNSVAPIAGCQSSITFPYGGAGPEYDPTCYAAGAIPVGSYRHTHYDKERTGFNADFIWETNFGDVSNTLRGGIWYEDYKRQEYRDWHKIIDSRVGYQFDHKPYWVQYSNAFPVDTMMMYLEDQIEVGAITARLGVKRFDVELEKQDKFAQTSLTVDSDSDTLFSAGIVVRTPVEGLEFFAGYAENFAAIKDAVLERDASTLQNIEPETADNIDVGLRYDGENISASVTYYTIEFENRLTFIAPDSPDGIDYLIGTNGSYINTGGIESKGIEASISLDINENWMLFASYTNNDSTYADRTPGFPAGNTVFGSAEDMAVISIDWIKEDYSAGLSTKWVGDRWMDAANTQRVDAYTVVDFYAGVSLGDLSEAVKDLEVRMTVNNLFDESYIGGIAGGSGWIGAPRTTAINLKASF
ncbi:TonB-dependent receptor domain-containing protein [Pseudoteredinibacter isoporae]|uniref:TonB-dependent receptor domain-containing protein n=1 Tax=Pseudoteredinibacter isoporae TaxID=570281 RepID=UPI00310618B8